MKPEGMQCESYELLRNQLSRCESYELLGSQLDKREFVWHQSHDALKSGFYWIWRVAEKQGCPP